MHLHQFIACNGVLHSFYNLEKKYFLYLYMYIYIFIYIPANVGRLPSKLSF